MKNKKSLRANAERQLRERYIQGVQLGLSISAVIIAIIALVAKI